MRPIKILFVSGKCNPILCTLVKKHFLTRGVQYGFSISKSCCHLTDNANLLSTADGRLSSQQTHTVRMFHRQCSTLQRLKTNFPLLLSSGSWKHSLFPWRSMVICYENLDQKQRGKAGPLCVASHQLGKLFGEHDNANQPRKKEWKAAWGERFKFVTNISFISLTWEPDHLSAACSDQNPSNLMNEASNYTIGKYIFFFKNGSDLAVLNILQLTAAAIYFGYSANFVHVSYHCFFKFSIKI